VVRKDLSPGLQLSQSCHAAMHFMLDHFEITKNWINASDHICILDIENEEKLLNLIDKIKENNVPYSIFRDSDINNEITSVALAPTRISKKLCSKFKLALK
jgi:peptidyl-tRNA hydrolase